jgi:hypothetical protein
VDALIRGDEIFPLFYINDSKGSGTDSRFDNRWDGDLPQKMVKALHHVGCRAALNLV